MTKAEMALHQAKYEAFISKARSAQGEGLYRDAIEAALLSFDHIDGMLQFGRKYEQAEFASIEGIDIVLALAPLLFDFQSVDKVEALLKGQRRIQRNTSADWNANLSNARALLIDACRLWDRLANCPDAIQDELRNLSGIDRKRWHLLIQTWEAFGLIFRVKTGDSVRLALVTKMDEPTLAKCPSCGSIARAPKATFLDEVRCPSCRVRITFVFLLAETDSSK